MNTYKVCMSVAGSDPSGGAGIQADLKTFTLLGCYGQAVPTALTVQSSLGVVRSVAIDASLVYEQMVVAMTDLAPHCVKIGIVPNAAIARAVAKALHECPPQFVVLDPIMISTSGHHLIDEEGISVVREELMPHCSLITPNLPEARMLTQRNDAQPDALAEKLCSDLGGVAVLVKGGHLEGAPTDVLCEGGMLHHFTTKRIFTPNSHGTGCVLSSAIAAYVAHGEALPIAVRKAKEFLTHALTAGADYVAGRGKGAMMLTEEWPLSSHSQREGYNATP